ncbi:MAG: hypothetical protein ACYDD1_21115, partial [Caulobacteraceae bacterium]
MDSQLAEMLWWRRQVILGAAVLNAPGLVPSMLVLAQMPVLWPALTSGTATFFSNLLLGIAAQALAALSWRLRTAGSGLATIAFVAVGGLTLASGCGFFAAMGLDAYKLTLDKTLWEIVAKQVDDADREARGLPLISDVTKARFESGDIDSDGRPTAIDRVGENGSPSARADKIAPSRLNAKTPPP